MKNRILYRQLWLVVLLTCVTIILRGQKVLLDEPVQAGVLNLFPSMEDPNQYYYILDKVRLAKHPNGEPQFSFLRYVQNESSAPGEADLEEGQGGGIVHALIELYLPNDAIRTAERELQRINPEGTIKGQVLYENGNIALISSFKADNGDWTKRVIGFGKAALMANQRMAISVQLTKEGSKILWASFQTPTPDMSISFEMGISGYRSPKRVIIEADFEQVYQHQAFDGASVTPVLANQIKTAFDDLVKTGAIKVTQINADENMEKAMETAYNKLIKMMFDPVGGTGVPNLNQLNQQQNGKSMLDRATEMLKTARNETREANKQIEQEDKEEEERYQKLLKEFAQKVKTENKEMGFNEENLPKPKQQEKKEAPEFAAAVSYQMKTSRQKGIFKIDLNKYTADKLSLRFDHNLGEGGINCSSCFKETPLDEALFKQREITAYLDGANATDFGDYINYFTVLLRKEHDNGKITLDEVKIDQTKFASTGNQFKLLYGWNGDNDPSSWYDYEYKVQCNYFGGVIDESEWIKAKSGALSLVPSFQKKTVDVEMDEGVSEDLNARSAEVKFFYKLGEKEFTKDLRLNFNRDEFSKQIELIIPNNHTAFDYQVTFHIKGEGPKIMERKSTNGTILYLDEVMY